CSPIASRPRRGRSHLPGVESASGGRYPRRVPKFVLDPEGVALALEPPLRFDIGLCWHPFRGALFIDRPTGGIASLNPRLMAPTPSGCLKSVRAEHIND